jgi:hypothetical protein
MISVRKEVGSMQGIMLAQIGENIQIVGISVNNLRIENEKMLSMGFGKLFDCLKKELMNNNDILISAIKESKENNDWYSRMESNLSIIFEEMKDDKKRDRIYREKLEEKFFE